MIDPRWQNEGPSPFRPYDEKTGEGLDRDEPTEAELDEYVAPGRPAEHALGVLYHADFETLSDGLCRHARMHARALADTGLPVMLRSIRHRVTHGETSWLAGEDIMHKEVVAQVRDLIRTTVKHAPVTIHQGVLRSAVGLRDLVVPTYARLDPAYADHVLRSAIVYTPWERDTVEPGLVGLLRRVGQIWLQCKRNVKVFEAAGLPPEKLKLVPNAYDERGVVAAIPARYPTVPSGKRFLNVAKWEPRKGQHLLLGGFLTAYGPKDAATLTIKTSGFGKWKDYPSDADESLETWLKNPRVQARGWTRANVKDRLRIEKRLFTDERMASLHALHNIYVSAAHAEAWDYPAFDALVAGNRLVYVGWGGPEDYALGDDVRVGWWPGDVHEGYGWEPTATWATYSVDLMAAALSRATPRPGRVTPAHIPGLYGLAASGARMRAFALALAREVEPDTKLGL
jgi:glycosyltransferase involved in cell wall biosynthesis